MNDAIVGLVPAYGFLVSLLWLAFGFPLGWRRVDMWCIVVAPLLYLSCALVWDVFFIGWDSGRDFGTEYYRVCQPFAYFLCRG